MNDYIIIEAFNPYDLESKVNFELNNGYSLYGDIFYYPQTPEKIYQAMIKY